MTVPSASPIVAIRPVPGVGAAGFGGVAGTLYLAARRDVRGLVSVIACASFAAGAALALVSWAVITVPVSYWVGGSVEMLTNQYIKAVVFFWLVGTLVTTARKNTNPTKAPPPALNERRAVWRAITARALITRHQG